jgi:DNA-binding transcriptional ArsR family regulator
MNSKKHQSNKINEIKKYPNIPDQINLSQKKLMIINHWQEIPSILEIEDPGIKIRKQELRSEILAILREGIKEYDKQRDEVISRHVFSAKEMQEYLEKKLIKKPSLSNIYFHLEKLQESELIKVVASIKEGRHVTQYYGRTAKLFLYKQKESDINLESNDKFFQKLDELIKKFNSDRDTEFNEQLFFNLRMAKKRTSRRVQSWIQENERILNELNLDLPKIYNLLTRIDILDSVELYTKTARLLNFPVDE